ncbi:MAG: hypothetical protein IPN90_03285 [Elusimicrobia bacterium]|nr:hypothetical protein [Elusimicrobiota bacterium]
MDLKIMKPSKNLFVFLLVSAFALTLEWPGLRWANYDYFWVDARNMGVGTVIRNSLLNLRTWNFDFDLGWNIASMNFFPLNPFLFISPKFGVLLSNAVSYAVGSFFCFKLVERITKDRLLSMALTLIYVTYPGFRGMPQNQLMFNGMMLAPIYPWMICDVFEGRRVNFLKSFLLVGFIAFTCDLTLIIFSLVVSFPFLLWKLYGLYFKRTVFNYRTFFIFIFLHIIWFVPWIVWYSQSETYGVTLRGLHSFLRTQRAYNFLFYPEFGSAMFWDLPPFFLSFIVLYFTDRNIRKYYSLFLLVLASAILPYLLQQLISSPTYLRWALTVPAASCWMVVAALIYFYKKNDRKNLSVELLLVIPILIDLLFNWALYRFFSSYASEANVVIGSKFLLLLAIYCVRYFKDSRASTWALALLSVSVVLYVYAPSLRSSYSKIPRFDKAARFHQQYEWVQNSLKGQNVSRLLLTGTSLNKEHSSRMLRNESGLYTELLAGQGFSVIGAYREKFDSGTGDFYGGLYKAGMRSHLLPPHESYVTPEILDELGVSHILLMVDKNEENIIERFEKRFEGKIEKISSHIEFAPQTSVETWTVIYKFIGGQPVKALANNNEIQIKKIPGVDLKWSIRNPSSNEVDVIWKYLPYRRLLLGDGVRTFKTKINDIYPFSVMTVPPGYVGIIDVDYKGKGGKAYIFSTSSFC